MPHNPITTAFRLTGVAIVLYSALSIHAEAVGTHRIRHQLEPRFPAVKDQTSRGAVA